MKTHLENFYRALTILAISLIIVALFYAYNLYRAGSLIGLSATNVISVTGKGEMDVKPDLSSVTLTIRENGKDAKEGEDKLKEKIDKLLASIIFLVEDKDIKTDSYSSYPKFSYPINQPAKIDSYEVSQTITVKVRNIENVGKVLETISAAGINEVSGPNYEIDDIENYKDDTRALAIKNANEKAEKLAKQLGVKIIRIVSFSEGGDYVQPMYMKSETTSVKTSAEGVENAPAVPTGENKVSSNVTITFEIR